MEYRTIRGAARILIALLAAMLALLIGAITPPPRCSR